MSDASDVPSGVPEATSAPASAPESYGARLAWERSRAGLSVNDIAARLRLHPNQILAIEREDLSKLPAVAYVRGFIRSYARLVNADAAALLTDFAARAAPGAAAGDAIARADGPSVSASADVHLWRRVVVAAALLVLIGLAVLGWYTGLRVPAPTAKVAIAPPSPPVQSTKSEPVAPPVEASEAADAIVPAAPVIEQPAGPAGSPPLLALEFSGPCWVQVTAADGRVLLSEQAASGVVRRVDGTLPLSVVLGDADHARVIVRGEQLELATFTRQNVARFSVN
jgi:cytoskeleton protein RodZ